MKILVVKELSFSYRRGKCTVFGAPGQTVFAFDSHKNERQQIAGGTLMKFNKWTLGLAAGGVVSLGSAVQAEEAQHQMSQVLTAVASTTLSGYVDTSAIWKFGTGNANLPGRQYDGPSKQDGFNLNVVGIRLEKPLSEEQWASGYKADLWFGPDAGTYRALIGNGGGDPNFAIKQAYLALRVPLGNGIDWKAGVF